MQPPEPSPAIRRLLSDVVDSIEKLEVLVHLQQTGPAPVSKIAVARGIPEPLVLEACAPLVTAGLLREQAGLYVYNPDNSRAEELAELGKLYVEDRIVVLRLIAQIAIERVRSQAATVFADAFVFRSKKRKDDPDA